MTDAEIVGGILLREDVTYTDRPADRGGPTKFGITLDTLRRWRNRPTTDADVQMLTIEEAQAIYLDQYVKPWAWITDDRLRVFLIDWGVNSRQTTVIRALQTAVGAAPDGIVGLVTRRFTAVWLEQDAAGLYRRLWTARLDHYLSLALDEPRLKVLRRTGPPMQIENLRGWLHRLSEFI